jgi:ABC-type Fe3+-hydroxamate transport system substrate-binding protein
MFEFYDDLGRKVFFRAPPNKVVSLCPSITETIFSLAPPEKIVGVTKFCVHPHNIIKDIHKIGGTKTVNISKIDTLAPDLIIAEKEENIKETIEILEKKYNVVVFNVESYKDALSLINKLGVIFDNVKKAQEISLHIECRFTLIPRVNNKNVLYFIWKKPYMVAGKNTYINDILEKLGFKNAILPFYSSRYPTLDNLQSISAEVDYIFLSSEPYPFQERHCQELSAHFRNSKIMLVDGEMFSWYGVRMIAAAPYFEKLISQL